MTDQFQAELDAFEHAQSTAERQGLVNAYVLRAVNLCVKRGILEPVLKTPVYITDKGERNCGALDVSEDELRTSFMQLSTSGYVHESLEYDDVFNGVISKGEVIH